MKVALIHYHLRAGGVTSVIRDLAASRSGECCILTGEKPQHAYGFPVEIVPLLGYDETRDTAGNPGQLYHDLLRAIRKVWGHTSCLLHFFNPTLGKNSLFPGLIEKLDKEGHEVAYHIFDFAEDGRHSNLEKVAYPARGHYITCTTRDRDILVGAGAQPEGVHVFPILKVDDKYESLPLSDTGDLYLLPVRARVRKNLGEAILLSALCRKQKRFMITLPPTGGKDLTVYNAWKSLSGDLALPFSFEAGLRTSLVNLYRESIAAISCSVREGYGYSFVEPWLYNRYLFGRDIPSVTKDIKAAGVRLDLYENLRIPFSRKDREELVHGIARSVTRAHAALERSIPDSLLESVCLSFLKDDTIDFARSSLEYQRRVVRRCAADSGLRNRIVALNPKIADIISGNVDPETCGHNRKCLARHFSSVRYTQRLSDLYERIINISRPFHSIDRAGIADSFLRCRRFFPFEES